jgi:hypothetical protein
MVASGSTFSITCPVGSSVAGSSVTTHTPSNGTARLRVRVAASEKSRTPSPRCASLRISLRTCTTFIERVLQNEQPRILGWNPPGRRSTLDTMLTTRAHTPEETHALIAAAFNASDLDAFVDADKEAAVVLLPPGGERAHGSDEIRSGTQPLFDLRLRPRSR